MKVDGLNGVVGLIFQQPIRMLRGHGYEISNSQLQLNFMIHLQMLYIVSFFQNELIVFISTYIAIL